MPRIKYVGTKADGERAFEAQTKIVWMPGDVHDISAAHAALMLPHTDVWDLADEAPATTAPATVDPQAADIGTTIDAPTLADAKRKPGRPKGS